MANILLAEDDQTMRHFLTAALERAGHSVTPCENGLQALDIAETQKSFDLLLADIIMPGIDGIELSQRVTDAIPDIKVVYITGFAGVAMDAQGDEAAQQARILSKPFHLNDLVNRIETVLTH